LSTGERQRGEAPGTGTDSAVSSSRESLAGAGWRCKEVGVSSAGGPSFSWINPVPLWQSRNQYLSPFLGDPTNDERRRWMEMRAARDRTGASVAQTLERFKLEPRSLVLEVTENTMVEDVDASVAILRRLKDLSVRIAIDDFGKGYSSLSYLKRLPVDILKLDRSFVDGLGTDQKDEGIVRAVIDLARTLGLEVVAEGLETGEQLAHLREMECELAQGFYFWEPLAAERSDELLATYNYP
jgi:EAL domain-containing protein